LPTAEIDLTFGSKRGFKRHQIRTHCSPASNNAFPQCHQRQEGLVSGTIAASLSSNSIGVAMMIREISVELRMVKIVLLLCSGSLSKVSRLPTVEAQRIKNETIIPLDNEYRAPFLV
jgi:hypothetical protein